eukprot:gb/GEZN01004201.1/.p1 GENE.gb/GEZN01004201.1/~~gb/GEZN01004201.1/.p1  ORF type:complete len:552 (+),score=105.29 gb/GEZN01004201.1/:89-1744(+)
MPSQLPPHLLSPSLSQGRGGGGGGGGGGGEEQEQQNELEGRKQERKKQEQEQQQRQQQEQQQQKKQEEEQQQEQRQQQLQQQQQQQQQEGQQGQQQGGGKTWQKTTQDQSEESEAKTVVPWQVVQNVTGVKSNGQNNGNGKGNTAEQEKMEMGGPPDYSASQVLRDLRAKTQSSVITSSLLSPSIDTKASLPPYPYTPLPGTLDKPTPGGATNEANLAEQNGNMKMMMRAPNTTNATIHGLNTWYQCPGTNFGECQNSSSMNNIDSPDQVRALRSVLGRCVLLCCNTGYFSAFCTVPGDACQPCPSPPEPKLHSPIACFPGSATVMLASGKTKALKQLQVGEEVYTLSPNGLFVPDTVIGWLHIVPANAAVSIAYVVIHFHRSLDNDNTQPQPQTQPQPKSASLKVTSAHLLPVRSNDAQHSGNGSAADWSFMFAAEVREGDWVLAAANPRAVWRQVVKVEKNVIGRDAYAPLTLSGTLLVDGVWVSCYAHFRYHSLMHGFMFPLRFVHRVLRKTGLSLLFLSDKEHHLMAYASVERFLQGCIWLWGTVSL